MNCTEYREKLTGTLAASETVPPGELSAHQQSCPGCRAFHDSQVNLFRSMDLGLLAVANEPIPPSFLPGVRARLNQEPTPHRAWFAGWRFALLAATAVTALLVGLLWHRPVTHPGVTDNGHAAPLAAGNRIPAVLPAQNSPQVSMTRAPRRASSPLSPAEVSATEPEVLVLPQEREAFARFVARLPEEKNVALALTRPAPERADLPVEIALLDLGNIEVKPLQSEARE